jgi:farnesyl-diphosphate farnesyltransferase
LLYYTLNPSELTYLFQMKHRFKDYRPSKTSVTQLAEQLSDSDFCFEVLKKVSRSFAIVIQQLPEELRKPICLFYLILRGLDTIEDDMQLNQSTKIELLQNFAKRINTEEFTHKNIGDSQDYKELMQHFDKILREYKKLDPKYKHVITSITERMAIGMINYANTEVDTFADWDDYCHYVAGIVGVGLSELFISSEIEDNPLLKDELKSNHMGLFLQKTNIIRDYAEDLEENRLFWPKQAWVNQVSSPEQLQQNPEIGIQVANELIINTLTHVPHCVAYLEALNNKEVFRFCAIPQLMAIATLYQLYDNKDCMTKQVKIRKGKTARYFMTAMTYKATRKEFEYFLKKFYTKTNRVEIKNILKELGR